jgi:hypothetical protein
MKAFRPTPYGLVIARLVLLAGAAASCADREPPVQEFEVLSQAYTIDTIYRSMQGPSATVDVHLPAPDEAELLWLTGYRATVVGPDGETPVPPEFMCHSNLGFDSRRHARLFGWTKLPPSRLFTVSQGQTEIRFPSGFGVPMRSDETLSLTTQVLNHNVPDTTLDVRVKVTIEYVRQRDLDEPLRPLYLKSANALVRLNEQGGAYGMAPAHLTPHAGSGHHGAAHGEAASSRVIEDSYGRDFAGHWVVPPGRQANTTDVTGWMNLLQDETAHFIAVHVHPFAHSLILRDATTGHAMFTSEMTGYPDRIGLSNVTAYADTAGLSLNSDHRYELTSVYENTSGQPQEAMAVMYLYLFDREVWERLKRN